MSGTKLKLVIGVGLFAAVLLGLGLGRSTVGTAEANTGDGKKPTAAAPAPAKAEPAEKAVPARADEDAKPEPGAAGPGKELTVRRPLGSYTREMQPFGKATLTFTEERLHLRGAVTVEKFTINFEADADYTLNRESLVYGVITGADVTGAAIAGAGEAAGAFGQLAALASDLPFAFRVRVEDDGITIKDIKAGPFGSPLLMEVLGAKDEASKTAALVLVACGKYKADPNPDRNAPSVARPKKK